MQITTKPKPENGGTQTRLSTINRHSENTIANGNTSRYDESSSHTKTSADNSRVLTPSITVDQNQRTTFRPTRNIQKKSRKNNDIAYGTYEITASMEPTRVPRIKAPSNLGEGRGCCESVRTAPEPRVSPPKELFSPSSSYRRIQNAE